MPSKTSKKSKQTPKVSATTTAFEQVLTEGPSTAHDVTRLTCAALLDRVRGVRSKQDTAEMLDGTKQVAECIKQEIESARNSGSSLLPFTSPEAYRDAVRDLMGAEIMSLPPMQRIRALTAGLGAEVKFLNVVQKTFPATIIPEQVGPTVAKSQDAIEAADQQEGGIHVDTVHGN